MQERKGKRMRKSKWLAVALAVVVSVTSSGEAAFATQTSDSDLEENYVETEYDRLVDQTVQNAGDYEQPECVELQEALPGIETIESTEDVAEEAATQGSAFWDACASDYSFNKMNSSQKYFYRILDDVCRELLTGKENCKVIEDYNVGVSKGVSYASLNLSWEEAKNIYTIFKMSNPQYYFLNNTYLFVDGAWYPTVTKKFCKGKDRASATAKIKSRIGEYEKYIKKASGARQKEKVAHDMIVQNVSYVKNEYDQTIYSTFVLNKTVCAGYAQAFELLMNRAGIDTVAVTSSEHEWNKIKLDGNWYVVDCTWDDLDGKVISGTAYAYWYAYMNRSSSVVNSQLYDEQHQHTEESFWSKFATPKCTKDAPVTYKAVKASSVSQSVKTQKSTYKKTYKPNGTFSLNAKSKKGSVKLSYSSNNKNVATVSDTGKVTMKGYGKATITIRALATNKYASAVKKVTVEVLPVAQKIKSLKQGKGSIKVSYQKDSRATGYEIWCATKSDFSNAKKVTVGSATSKVVSGLKSYTKYYVRVRSYKKCGSAKVTGNWSSVKNIRTK